MIVKINLGILKFDLDECSIDSLDRELNKQIRNCHKESFKAFLEKQDKVLVKKKVHCPKCHQQMRNLGRPAIKIGLLSGTAEVKRTRFRCLSCKTERYPLDEIWKTNKKHTLETIEKALYLATEISYEKASIALNKLTGAQISHGQIQSCAKEEGSLVNQNLEQMASDLFELGLDPGEVVKRSKDDTLIIAIDGGHIPDRASKDAFEAKVGVIYGLKAKVSKNRIALVDRIGYAGVENASKFGQKLYCLARQHGVMSAGKVLAIGDGAKWIKALIKDLFPYAIYLLDLFHLKKRISCVLNQEDDENLKQAIFEVCQRGNPDEALNLLDSYRSPTPEKAEELKKLKHYISSNKEGIANYAKSNLFGSGAVEKAVDILVSRRFKLRGMSWFKPGASGMLALRLLRFNGQWESYWHKRFEGLVAT